MQASTENGQGLGSELKDNTKSMASAAVDRLHSEVDSRKGGGVNQINEVSSALKKTADEMSDGSPEWLKSALQKGADQISNFAQSLEQKDSRQMVDDLNSFARQSPGTFLAACAAAGFAAARIFKAGTTDSSSDDSPGEQINSDEFTYEVGSSETSGLPGSAMQGAVI